MSTDEIINTQAQCIIMLSRIVDGLYSQLSQKLTVEELDRLSETRLVKQVSEMIGRCDEELKRN